MCYRFAAVVALLLVSPLAAQDPSQAQQQVAALKAILGQDKAAMAKYSWTETTQIAVKGEVKKVTHNACHYGPDGRVQKTPMDDEQPAQGGGGGGRQGKLKQRVVAKKVGELKDDMTAIAELVHQYVPPDAERTQEAVKAGNASASPADGARAISFVNYVKQGDKLSIEIDPATSRIRRLVVSTYHEGPDDPVSFIATFDVLGDGTGYMRQTQLDSPKRQVRVTITNAGHQKTSS
jgi:hypothetical protein